MVDSVSHTTIGLLATEVVGRGRYLRPRHSEVERGNYNEEFGIAAWKKAVLKLHEQDPQLATNFVRDMVNWSADLHPLPSDRVRAAASDLLELLESGRVVELSGAEKPNPTAPVFTGRATFDGRKPGDKIQPV